MRNSQSDNRQLLSIAATDDELRAPYRRMILTWYINSQDRPIDATDHQQSCLVAATATPPRLRLEIIWSVRRNCDSDRRRRRRRRQAGVAAAAAARTGVTAWESCSQTVVHVAEAGSFESLPGSLSSLLAATHSAVRTSVMGKS